MFCYDIVFKNGYVQRFWCDDRVLEDGWVKVMQNKACIFKYNPQQLSDNGQATRLVPWLDGQEPRDLGEVA